ncbi:MAG: hypothetical protein U0136_06550 [Bdellovibrionota bacterium]
MSTVLLVTSKNQLRTSFRQLLANIEGLGSPLSVGTMSQAKEQLAFERKFRFVFISNEFSDEDCAEFIAKARAGEDPEEKTVFVLIFSGQVQDPELVANRMIAGFHGFLCEPFTLESVTEMAALSAKVSQQQTLIRMKAATGILLSDVGDRPSNQHPAVPLDLLQESQDACTRYNEETNESITMILAGILKRGGIKERLNGVRTLKDRGRSVREPVRVFLRRLFPNRRDIRPR